MSRQLCPKCLELLSDALECMVCGGHYEWVEREEIQERKFRKEINKTNRKVDQAISEINKI